MRREARAGRTLRPTGIRYFGIFIVTHNAMANLFEYIHVNYILSVNSQKRNNLPGEMDIPWLLIGIARLLHKSAVSGQVSGRNSFVATSQALSVLSTEANLMDEKWAS